MSRPKAVIRVSTDRAAFICVHCPDKKQAEEWAINLDYEIRLDECPKCHVSLVNKVSAHAATERGVTDQERADTIKLFQGWIDRNQ